MEEIFSKFFVQKLWIFQLPGWWICLFLKDPTNDLIQIAEARGMLESRFQALSLGQGQAPFATRMLKEGVREVFAAALCWYALNGLTQQQITCVLLES